MRARGYLGPDLAETAVDSVVQTDRLSSSLSSEVLWCWGVQYDIRRITAHQPSFPKRGGKEIILPVVEEADFTVHIRPWSHHVTTKAVSDER